MSEKERLRKTYLEMVSLKKLTLSQAAEPLGISYRQAKRLYRRYKLKNDEGLIHKSRGQTSNNKHAHQETILKLYEDNYRGFGPTLAAEKLAEDHRLAVSRETLRRWLIKKELWQKQRKRSPHRRHRECRAQFGELIQIDGSIHDWLEDGTHRCLMNMVDDATGKTLSHLDESETTSAVFNIIWNWIDRYGIPVALYVDLKNVYVTLKDNTYSHLELACAKLGIQIIKAYSPQAKGRVERNHAVYQDRFVKELRLKKIKTLSEANAILKDGFVEKLNQKFEKVARNPNSAHRPLSNIDLNQVFCWEYERQVQHDWTFSIKTQLFQIKKQYGSFVRPKLTICIRQHMDGSTSAWYKGVRLDIIKLTKKPEKVNILLSNVISINKGKELQRRTSPWIKSNGTLFKETKYRSSDFRSKSLSVSRQLAKPKP